MPPRYLIGIDLGTTNSVVAYIDTEDADPGIRVFPVPQLVAQGEVRTLSALPSFLYFPTQDELSAGAVSATWDEDPPMVTGLLAREQGALVPNRQVSSAKSWLCSPGVDRRGKILPAQAEAPQPRISPVEASARYLMHLRDAWNNAMGSSAEARFQQQEIVLTVPASFDEVARELTVEAAGIAGLENITLLEEPLAAFYSWIAAGREAQHGSSPTPDQGRGESSEELRDGELILVCDIGGGTSDFSLMRARRDDGELRFERAAIGEHLLLGGDNLDLALAGRVEEKLGGVRLTMRQRSALRRVCCAAKERLLSDPSLERAPVTLLGSGRSVVGQAIRAELTRAEVLDILTAGLLPITAPGEMPAQRRQAGLRELGLPYASDPAITRHLAAFLTQAVRAMNGASSGAMARPDAVLFNGGFCAPAVTRERIVEALSAWFGGEYASWQPRVLHNEDAESAVARGAAYYARVKRGAGLRVRAGSARTYYIGLPSNDGLEGICILPAGVDEGTTLPLVNREFSLVANRPVSFTLYSSRTRHDAHGQVAALNKEEVHRHPPLTSVLRYGRKMRETHLAVRLRATFTEVGTLELWCESLQSPHRWRLQFELRGEEAAAQPERAPRRAAAAAASDEAVEAAAQLIRKVFGESADDEDATTPETLTRQIEAALGEKRDSWPVSAIRRFCDVLREVAAGRRKSARHEVRWLNLYGHCLRPGFGAPGDAQRVGALRAVTSHELVFADDLQCQVEMLVLLRRIAGGISASEQQALYRRVVSGRNRRKRGRQNRQIEYEEWRLIANLEHLLGGTRASLGEELLEKIWEEPENAIWLWSLGRLGARIPLYGPSHCIVAADTAGAWVRALLDLPALSAAATSAILLMARRTGDGARDIDDALREEAMARLTAMGAAPESVQLLSKYVPPERADAVRSFGESLPPGLELVSSSKCLLSVAALHNAGGAAGTEGDEVNVAG